MGGVVDFGEFHEGSCLKIITRESGKIVWVLCFENNKKKTNFLDFLRAVKIDEQHQDGLIVLKQKLPEPTLSQILGPKKLSGAEFGEGRVSFNSTQKVTDGYWITIQSWTQCSLKCGGGTMTLHRECVMGSSPESAPCKGEPIFPFLEKF